MKASFIRNTSFNFDKTEFYQEDKFHFLWNWVLSGMQVLFLMKPSFIRNTSFIFDESEFYQEEKFYSDETEFYRE